MSTPSKSFGIDPVGRVLLAEVASVEVATKQVTVGSSPTVLKSDSTMIKRRKLFLRNISTDVAYIGGSNVSSSNGFPLYQYDEIELDVNAVADVRGVKASGAGTVTVYILELE